MQTWEERFQRNRHAWERYEQAFKRADMEAAQAIYGAASANQTVRVEMGGDFRIRALGIHPEAYETMDEHDLADAVIGAYNNARQTVHAEQMRRLRNPMSEPRREPRS